MKRNVLKRMMAVIVSAGMLAGVTGAFPAVASEVGSEADNLIAEEGAEVEIAYWEGSESDKAAFDEALENLAKDHPEISVIPQTYPSSEYMSMLDTRVAGNDWPDIIRYNCTKFGKFKNAGVMLDLAPYLTQESIDDLTPAFKAACTYDGELVAMPLHTDTMGIFYNKRMFEETGIRIPESVEDGYTWEEIKDIAATLKEKYDLPFGCAGIWEISYGSRYLPFIYMNGGAMLNDAQDEITMDTPQVLEAIQYYADLRADDLIANTAFTGPMTANTLFAAEQVAFTFSGSWHCSYMTENAGDNWGVTYMPQRDGKTSSDLGGTILFGYAGTKYPKATAIVIDYLTRAENMKRFCETGGFIPVRTSLIEEGLEYRNYPDEMKIFNEIAATVDPKMAQDMTSVPFQELNQIFCEEMDPLVVDGSATPEEVVANCQEYMTDALGEYGE